MSEEKPDNYPVESSDVEIPFVSEKLKEEFSITHDSFFKQTFGTKDIAQAFLRHVLPPEIVCQLNLDKLEIQNGSLTDSDYFKNSAADLIYVVPLKQGAQNLHVDVILEHKSQPDQFTIFQLTRYTVRILEKELKAAQESDKTLKYFRFPTVIPIIIHNGDTPFTSPCELKELFNILPGAERYALNLEAILFDLNQIPFTQLPRDVNVLEFEPVLKVMQAILRHDIADRIQEALQVLRPYSQIPKYRQLTRLFIVYLLRRARNIKKEKIKEILFSNNNIDQGDKGMVSIAEQLFMEGQSKGLEQGREQGREKGREEGMEKGMEEGIRNSILLTLKTRFGDIPESISKKISEKTDRVTLDSLLISAVTVKTLADFEKDL